MNSLFGLFDSVCAKILSEKSRQSRFPSNDKNGKNPDGHVSSSPPQNKNNIDQKIGEYSSEPEKINGLRIFETLALY